MILIRQLMILKNTKIISAAFASVTVTERCARDMRIVRYGDDLCPTGIHSTMDNVVCNQL